MANRSYPHPGRLVFAGISIGLLTASLICAIPYAPLQILLAIGVIGGSILGSFCYP